jgi:hypothetical protein
MHKTDLPITPNKQHTRYFIYTDETRFLHGTFSIATHRLKFLCTLHNKIEVICIIPQHIFLSAAQFPRKWTIAERLLAHFPRHLLF